jgi:hypothetical protein
MGGSGTGVDAQAETANRAQRRIEGRLSMAGEVSSFLSCRHGLR